MAASEIYPNLKITVGNDDLDVDEDASISGCESDHANETATKDVEIHRKFISPLDRSRIYVNKGGAFITGLDLTSEAITKKLVDRAARFGLEENVKKAISQSDIDALYKSLNIELDEMKQPTSKSKNIRLDAIHMRGVDEMSTNDVFDYFKEYGPASVEWINDYSCNVVWLDTGGAARALLGLSRVLVVKKKSEIDSSSRQIDNNDVQGDKEEVIFMSDIELGSDSSEEDDDDKLVGFKHEKKGNPKKPEEEKEAEKEMPMETDSVEISETKEDGEVDDDDDVPEVPVPPGHWRLGIPHPKAKAILLRYATRDDRKLPGAEKRSEYYKKYGNPNYGGLKGLISKTKKRKFSAIKQRQVVEHLSGSKGSSLSVGLTFKPVDSIEDKRKKPKKLRMRMCADDEEERLEKLKKKSLHRLLLEERVSLKREREVSRRQRSSVHDRLGSHQKRENVVEIIYRTDPTSEEEEDHDVKKDEEHGLTETHIRSAVSWPGSKATSKDKSRFDVWTRLAESMAKESEDPETNYQQDRRYSRNDLRERLSHKPSRHKEKESKDGSDLRSKLNRRRERKSSVSKHRSPLVIGT